MTMSCHIRMLSSHPSPFYSSAFKPLRNLLQDLRAALCGMRVFIYCFCICGIPDSMSDKFRREAGARSDVLTLL